VSVPKFWSTLHDEDGSSAIVVPEGTDPLEALVELLNAEYGRVFSRDNPVLVKEAAGLKIQRWFSCTKAWKEAESVGEEEEEWWAPNGDGKRSIFVVSSDRSTYVLGEIAEEADEILNDRAWLRETEWQVESAGEQCADEVEAMCHWKRAEQHSGKRTPEAHRAFHFGYTCPYEAMAAVLRGQPDPRESPSYPAPEPKP
jgi:hypothetical protein